MTMPKPAATQIPAAVVKPLMMVSCLCTVTLLMIVPAPKKPIPVMTPDRTLETASGPDKAY